MKYFIYRNDRQEGPYEAKTIVNMRLSNDTFVWNETMSDWQPIGTIPELQQPHASAPPYQPNYGQPNHGQPNYGQPNYGPSPAYAVNQVSSSYDPQPN